jgi:ketose-bisphosphate aldolase
MIEKCIEDQWTSVMIDASDRPMEENIKITKQVVDKAQSGGVSVEGEIGSIFSVDDSKDFREKPDHLATVESCLTYFEETNVNALAPAIGTAHGLYKDTPSLDFDRLSKISKALEIPVVIHGGTGLTDDDFKELIRQGSRKINIATQICLEYMEAIRDFTRKSPDSSDPLSFFECADERIKASVKQFIELFGSKGKA